MKEISDELYARLEYLGIVDSEDVRERNVGSSNYSSKLIQPWTVWLAYPELTSFDHDIIKRVLRLKEEKGMSMEGSRLMDYRKIIHICEERIRQLELVVNIQKGGLDL